MDSIDGLALAHLAGVDIWHAQIGAKLNGGPVSEEGFKRVGFADHGTLGTASPSDFQDKSYRLVRYAAFDMKSAADRLRELRIKKGYANASDAARAFGWNENTYKSHENAVRGIKPDAARKYAAAYGSTPAFILGMGNVADLPVVNSVTNVPLVARASAGSFREDEGLEIEGILVPAVPRGDVPAGVQYAIVIDGESVNKKIPDGAFAICAPFDKYPGGPKHGQLVHVVRERAGLHEHTIKELHYTRDGMVLMPCSTDPRYQEAVVLSSGEDDTTVRIHGVVIGAYRPF